MARVRVVLAPASTSPHPSLQRRGTGAQKEVVKIINELLNIYRDDRREKAGIVNE